LAGVVAQISIILEKSKMCRNINKFYTKVKIDFAGILQPEFWRKVKARPYAPKFLLSLRRNFSFLSDEEREHQDRRAKLAIDIFCHRVKKYIGAYLAELGGADAIIFTGGIGENSPALRRRVCAGLEWLGIATDEPSNAQIFGGREGEIGAPDSRVKVFVIPTNEELLIARDTVRCIKNAPRHFHLVTDYWSLVTESSHA
jgi:hypothetical protein